MRHSAMYWKLLSVLVIKLLIFFVWNKEQVSAVAEEPAWCAGNVLPSKVHAECDKRATELSWQRLWRSTFSIYSKLFVESRQF